MTRRRYIMVGWWASLVALLAVFVVDFVRNPNLWAVGGIVICLLLAFTEFRRAA